MDDNAGGGRPAATDSPDTATRLAARLGALIDDLPDDEAELLVEMIQRATASDDADVVGFAFEGDPMGFGTNTQLLNFTNAVEAASTSFSSVSNVLKTRHDTVKNSISNVR
jgi:hypothetical protein